MFESGAPFQVDELAIQHTWIDTKRPDMDLVHCTPQVKKKHF